MAPGTLFPADRRLESSRTATFSGIHATALRRTTRRTLRTMVYCAHLALVMSTARLWRLRCLALVAASAAALAACSARARTRMRNSAPARSRSSGMATCRRSTARCAIVLRLLRVLWALACAQVVLHSLDGIGPGRFLGLS